MRPCTGSICNRQTILSRRLWQRLCKSVEAMFDLGPAPKERLTILGLVVLLELVLLSDIIGFSGSMKVVAWQLAVGTGMTALALLWSVFTGRQ